jgi:hypothetical protein
MMPESTRREITLEDATGSDENISKIIEKEGLVNLPARVLQAVTGKLFLEAREEALARFAAQCGPGAEKWAALFHDLAHPDLKQEIRVGDGNKKMSDNLPLGSKIVQYVETAASVLRPGYAIGREPDGRPHIVLMNHLNPPEGSIGLFSREHYGQEQHDDLPVHGAGAEYSDAIPQACCREDPPLVMWVSFWQDPISLFFFLKSHIIGRIVSLFFVHYAPLLAEYLQQRPESTVADFKPIWAAFVEEHVEAELKRLGIRVEPGAVLHSVEPYGAALWHAFLIHGGTSMPGLRAFAVLLKQRDQGQVELPQRSIELVRVSRVFAGVFRKILRPLDVALASQPAAKAVSQQVSDQLIGSTRYAAASVQDVVLAVLDKVRVHEVRPIPAHDDSSKPELVPFKHSKTMLGLVCQCSTVGRGKVQVVVWMEFTPKDSDPKKGALYRGAAITQHLLQTLDRRAPEELKAFSGFLLPRQPVTTVDSDQFSLLYCPGLMEGEPLNHRLERDLQPWKKDRELTESLRHALYNLVRLLDRLLDYGLRLVVFDPSLFSIGPNDQVKLIFSGGAYLGPRTVALCNRKTYKGSLPLMRRNTSMHRPGEEECGRARMNMRSEKARLQECSHVALMQDQDHGAEAGPAAAAFTTWSDSDMRTWVREQHGKTGGVLGRWNVDFEDLVADDDLTEDLKAATAIDPIMDLLRLTDVHQVMVWLICELRKASGKADSWASRKEMLKHVLEKSETITSLNEGMEHFILGKSPIKPKPGRGAVEKDPALPCNQPAALNRLLEMIIFSLHAAYREQASKELSYMLFLTTAVFSPGDELKLSQDDGGIPIMVQLYPFNDPAFKKKVDAMFFRMGANLEDLRVKFPRRMFLRNEGEYGVGVFGPDTYEEGDFLGFYLGTVEDEPHGRHVVTSKTGKAKYCNGGNSRLLPVSAHLERGTPGSYMNSSANRRNKDGSSMKANARADRKNQILHTHEGRRFACIPMFCSAPFSKAFTVWPYDPEAGHGSSFRSG